tara:strand:+ start:10131 stop:12113 length:1983 start_codon:yes stop_codon:yes gene_type:complete
MNSKKNTTGKNVSKGTTNEKKGKLLDAEETKPLMADFSESSTASTRTRRNAASTIVRSDRFKNIKDGLVPWKYSTGSKYQQGGVDAIDVEEAVALCQKAYYNFSVFRNTIDLMTEFSVSDVFLKGGSKKSRRFLEALFKKMNLKSFMDKFFREYYRSGNVFIYRFESTLQEDDLRKITQTFGGSANQSLAAKVEIPTSYIVLNPADVRLTGSLSFSTGRYSKIVSNYELHRLRNPESEEEIEMIKNLPDSTKKQLEGKSTRVMIPLNPDKFMGIFYKKQDYEPFAVPMGYPVLEDINAKYEIKKIDMAIARTMQQAILLVTMGTEPEKGGVNQKNLEAMQNLFANESVGRVLIADYTTKAEFVVPNIAQLLDSKKYEIFDRDIRIGLNNILLGEDEKFANASIKVKVFIERLKQARETFISDFLMPEIKRICRQLGFKNYPVPQFQDIDLKDDLSYAKVYTRLVELGLLTAEEGISAMETGRLPNSEESVESQGKFKELRDEGLYQPIIGGAKTGDAAEVSKPTGRPSGTDGVPQEEERGPTDVQNDAQPSIASEVNFSLAKVKDNLILAQHLNSDVEKALRSKHKIKRLTNKQKEIASDISEIIMANESPENWKSEIKNYIKSPIDKNPEQVKEINNLAATHQVDYYLASILFASKKDN